jgi:hypothetical protein
VPFARPQDWLRTLPLIVALGAIGATGFARPALASGCHALDRPVLGLSFSWEEPSGALEPAASPAPEGPAVTPLPCSDDAPGAVSSLSASPLALCAPRVERLPRPSPSGEWRRWPPEPSRVARHDVGIERPPRSLKLLG